MMRFFNAGRPPADREEQLHSALIRRVARQDSGAFEQLYKSFYPRLYRFVYRMAGQTEIVEELVQETMLTVWQNPGQFNFTCKLSTWIMGIAYHKTLKALARQRQFSCEDSDLAEEISDTRASGNPEAVFENQQWLAQALTALSPDQRAVIELTFYQDLSYQDIAKILDCPENTVKTRMFHARKKLQALACSEEE